MRWQKSLQISAATTLLIAVFLTILMSLFFDRDRAMHFFIGNVIFLFSVITTDLLWGLMIRKKQVALGTFLIVSKYLTFFVFMSVLMKQNWPTSIWLFVGFVASKILFLSGYFIMKKRFS